MAQSHQLIQRDTQLIFSVMMKVLVAQSCPTLEFSRQEYWSGQPFSSPADLPDPGTESTSPALAGGLFTTEPPGKPVFYLDL